jgi:hypothetical protein
VYCPDWDDDPAAYVAADVVGWGRGRRLGRLALPTVGLLAYIGVQHVDPARWGQPGAPRACFFASCTVRGHVWLRNFPTVAAALAALDEAIGRASQHRRTKG